MNQYSNQVASLYLDALRDPKYGTVEITDCYVDEGLSSGFVAVVNFTALSAKLPFDEIVGRGGALSLTSSQVGTRIWAGVVSELELIKAAAFEGAIGTENVGQSRYRLTIRPALHRLTLRRTSRIFQHKTVVEIVKDVLKEWHIPVVEALDGTSTLRLPHPQYEYKVQYDETDFDFVSRLLEEEGITYRIVAASKLTAGEKKGYDVTHLLLEDSPQEKTALYGKGKKAALRFVPGQPVNETGDLVWDFSAVRTPRAHRLTLRDTNFRGTPDHPPTASAAPLTRGEDRGKELPIENYAFLPGAHWAEQSGDSALASDDLAIARVDAKLASRVATRMRDSVITGRTQVKFRANVFALDPGAVFSIGSDEADNWSESHPHPDFGPNRRLMVVKRSVVMESQSSGIDVTCIAVYADEPYQPPRTIQKPRIYGVQSALVVGPEGKEIYLDEFGRVRVQFAWDREGKFNERSSCWMRVSHPSAGGSFGFVAHPRVGHEVLVGFFEGDPDQPIIVGRVYNSTAAGLDGKAGEHDASKSGYFPATAADVYGDNATKSGFRTDSSPHSGENNGYNELMFQDAVGKERVHIQAQRDMSVVVKRNETHDVQELFQVIVGDGKGGPHSVLKITPTSIMMTTGEKSASIVISGGDVFVNATGEVHIHSGDVFHVSATGTLDMNAHQVDIDTEGRLNLNCGVANIGDPCSPDHKCSPATPTGETDLGFEQGPPFIPETAAELPAAPGAFNDVTVRSEEDEEMTRRQKLAGGVSNAQPRRVEDVDDMAYAPNRPVVPGEARIVSPSIAQGLVTAPQAGSLSMLENPALVNTALARNLARVNMALTVLSTAEQVAGFVTAAMDGGMLPAAANMLTGAAVMHGQTMVANVMQEAVSSAAIRMFTPPSALPFNPGFGAGFA